MPIYSTLDNGGRPFKVVVQKTLVTVYKKDEDVAAYTRVVGMYKLSPPKTRVWVGRSSGKFAETGNSIVVQNGTQCVFIGHEVYEFSLEAGDSIQAYYSLVGNNSVPYPVLRGTKNVYFMLDKKFVALDKLHDHPRTKGQWENLYGEFYGHIHPPGLEKTAHKMKHVKVISK
jgi:hypothetical protein